MRRVGVALSIAALGLAGTLLALLVMYSASSKALRVVFDERLRGAGETGALLMGDGTAGAGLLASLMEANSLDGAFVVGPKRRVLVDATGATDRPLDLLRIDADALRQAQAGQTAFVDTVSFGQLKIRTGYFPLQGQSPNPGDAAGSAVGGSDRAQSGDEHAVLVLEAGHSFFSAEETLRRAILSGGALALLAAAALMLVASRWARAEQDRSEALARATRGETLVQLAAMASHEIRNPLGVIRANVELMQERARGNLAPRDREALSDVLQEVHRLRRLTDDLLELASSRAIIAETVDLADLLRQVARSTETLHDGTSIRLDLQEPLSLTGDSGRLRQVFANLLRNAAEAAPKSEVTVRAFVEHKWVKVQVKDQGPGVPEDIRASLFTPFSSGKLTGTGLGLALSRRLIERHQGSLSLVPCETGALFEVVLPRELLQG